MRSSLALAAALVIGLASFAVAARPGGRMGAPAVQARHAGQFARKSQFAQKSQYAQKTKRHKPEQYRPSPSEQDRTLDDMRKGRIKAFSDIRRQVNRQVGGRILDAELDRFSKPWVYKVRVLTDDGNVLAIRLDARTGRILNVRGRKR